jgi:hypothetical protein
MVECLVLVEHQNVDEEKLRSLSLMNAKQLVVGSVPWGWGGTILHLAANSPDDLGKALLAFAQVAGVTRVLTLALQSRQ